MQLFINSKISVFGKVGGAVAKRIFTATAIVELRVKRKIGHIYANRGR